MKKLISTTILILFLPCVAMANCGAIPEAPQLLEEDQLTGGQLDQLEPLMKSFIESIAEYRACIDDAVAGLVPDNATETFLNSTEYQNDFNNLVNYSDLAEQSMSFSVERFNFLVEGAGSQ